MSDIHASSNEILEEFQVVFEKYKNLVFKTAYLMTGSTLEAEDILQEVFLSVYKYLPTYDASKGALSTWLHRITVNQCSFNRKKNAIQYEWSELPDIPSPLQDKDQAETIEKTQQAIAALSDKLRAVVILRYTWELPYSEIAQILDIPLGTVKSRLDLAFRTLRKELTDTPGQQHE